MTDIEKQKEISHRFQNNSGGVVQGFTVTEPSAACSLPRLHGKGVVIPQTNI